MKRIYVSCYECEHEGDLGMYMGQLRSVKGVKIISSSLNNDDDGEYSSETGTIVIEVDEKDWDRIRKEISELEFAGFLAY